MPITINEGNQQKLEKNKKLDPMDMHNKLDESKSNTRPFNPDNHHNNMAESAVDKNTFDEKFDHTEEKIRDMSYIHRDIQMRLLKTKKEPLES